MKKQFLNAADPLKRCEGANISGMIEELEDYIGYGNDGTDEDGVFKFLKNHTYEDLVCMDPYFKSKGFDGTVAYILDDFMGPIDSNSDAIKLAHMLADLMKGKFGVDKAYTMVREMGGPDLYKDPDTGKYGWHSGSFQEGYTPQPLNEQRSKYKQGRNKVKVKPGKGDKDYKLVVTKDYQFDPNNLSSSDMAFKIIKDHSPIASAHPDLSPEQLIFSTRKDGRRRDVFTFMIVDKQLPPEEKEEIKKETEKLVTQVDVEKEENKVEKEEGNVEPQPTTSTDTQIQTRICNLRGDKTWEYKVEDEMWYTRRQGSSRWIKLGGDKYIKARCKLDKGCPDFRKTREQNCSSTSTQTPGDGDRENLGELVMPSGCNARFLKGWLYMMNYDYKQNNDTITDSSLMKYKNALRNGYRFGGQIITLKDACSCIDEKYISQLRQLINIDKEILINLIGAFQKYICPGSTQDRTVDQDLPKDQQFPLIEGCTTQGTAGTKSLCTIIPRDNTGRIVTAVMGAYYDPKQGKCIQTTGGYAPFRGMEKCKQCCEKRR